MSQNFKDAKILIADGSGYNLANIQKILNSVGYNNIIFAVNVPSALNLIKDNLIELIIIDASLTIINVIDICKAIRQSPQNFISRILVQSDNPSPKEKEEAFEAGVNDFINKPIEIVELIARVKAQLTQYFVYKSLIETNHRMVAELNEAKNILEDLLPNVECFKKISDVHNISFASYYKPSSELGGDFFDIMDTGNNKLVTYLWDFSGHGVSAAINTFRLHSIVGKNRDEFIYDPGKFLTNINNILHTILTIQNYATMFYCVIDLKKKVLEYSCASCPPPILLSFNRRKGEVINTRQFPLGVKKDNVYETKSIDLKKWDALILYSDALIETPKKNNKFLSYDEIINILLEFKGKKKVLSANEIKDVIINEFNRECFDNLSDDLTLEVINFK